MPPSGPPRASTKKDTVAGSETDTQWTQAKLGSVGERDQNSETDHFTIAPSVGGLWTWSYHVMSEMDRWPGMVRWRRIGIVSSSREHQRNHKAEYKALPSAPILCSRMKSQRDVA